MVKLPSFYTSATFKVPVAVSKAFVPAFRTVRVSCHAHPDRHPTLLHVAKLRLELSSRKSAHIDLPLLEKLLHTCIKAPSSSLKVSKKWESNGL